MEGGRGGGEFEERFLFVFNVLFDEEYFGKLGPICSVAIEPAVTGIVSPSSARQNPRPEPGGHAASHRTTQSRTSRKTCCHVDCRPRHIIPLDRLSGWPLRGRT